MSTGYKGGVPLTGGLEVKGGGDKFPLVEAHDVYCDKYTMRLDEQLEAIRSAIASGGGGSSGGGSSGAFLNIKNGTGNGAIEQSADKVADGFDFTGKNPNAEAIDPSLSAVQPYGGVGDFSNSFGGKSSAQGKRSHAEGTTTIAKGNYSHAEGDNAVALGADSHAEGYRTTAYATGSHAEGSETVVGAVLAGHLFGDYAHAEGIRTKALMDASHAEGYQTTANGEHSHSEGTDTTAVNTSSHAEGRGTRAGGDGAHSEGVNTETAATAAHAEGALTKALKAHSHAEGYQTTANGEHSHSEGIGTSTNGAAAHAEGSQSGAYGDYSHAGGIDSQVKGHAAFAHGIGLDANGTSQAVFGEYNSNDGDALLEIGNGSSRLTPSTAFRVKRDGRAQASGAALDPEDLVRLDDIDRPVTEHLLFNGSRFVVLAPSIASVNDAYTVRSGKWRLRDISSIDTSKIQGAVLRGRFSSNGMQFTDVVMGLTDSGLTVAYSDPVGQVTTVVLGDSIVEDYLDIEVDYLTAEQPRSRLKYSTFTQLFEYVIEYNIYEHNINLTANTNVEIIQDSASSGSRNSDIHCRFTLLHAKSTKLSPGDILNALSLDERSATGYFWNKSIGSVYAIVHSIGLNMDDRLLISGIELDKLRSFCYIDLTSDMYTDDIRVL